MNRGFNYPELVKFVKIEDCVINLDTTNCIYVEYIVDKTVHVTYKDWLALFPKDCDFLRSFDLKLIVAYEFVLSQPITKQERRYRMEISLKGATDLKYGQEYQFAYINSYSEVIGVSKPFKFLELVAKGNFRGKQISIALASNNNKADLKTSEDSSRGNRRVKQGMWTVQEKKPVEENESKDEDYVVDFTVQNDMNFEKKYKSNKQGFLNKVNQLSLREKTSDTKVIPSSKNISSSCSNCQRVGALLNTQTQLYQQVKNLAELNNDLQKQVHQLQHQLEMGHAQYQKLAVVLKHERQMKMFYQAMAQENCSYQIVCVYQQIVVGLDSFHRPIYTICPVFQYAPLVSQVMAAEGAPAQLLTPRLPNHHQQENPRPDEKNKPGSIMKLKAIIGNQEETIRELNKRLAELENDRTVQKVRAIVRDFENLDCGDNNNNDKKAVEAN